MLSHGKFFMGFRRKNWPYGGQFSLDKGKENLSETSCKKKRELVNYEIVVVGRHVRLGNTNCRRVFFFSNKPKLHHGG